MIHKSDTVTIPDEIHLVPKDLAAAVITLTLCLASVHGLKSFMNLVRASWLQDMYGFCLYLQRTSMMAAAASY